MINLSWLKQQNTRKETNNWHQCSRGSKMAKIILGDNISWLQQFITLAVPHVPSFHSTSTTTKKYEIHTRIRHLQGPDERDLLLGDLAGTEMRVKG